MTSILELYPALPTETLDFVETFSAVSPSGLNTPNFKTVVSGPGMTISQAGGVLNIASGTTVNSETILRSRRPFAGALTGRFGVSLSQRIANNSLEIALTDVLGDALAMTVNSSTSITVVIPQHPFDPVASIGMGVNIGAFTLAGCIPGRYTISAVSGDSVTFAVTGFPASGTGTCSVFGWNYHKLLYSDTTSTRYIAGASHNGWLSGDITLTCNSTASPGHVAVVNVEDGIVTHLDQLASTNNSLVQLTQRGLIVQTIPDETVQLYLQIRVINGSTAPASTTTASIGFVRIEKFNPKCVAVSSIRPQSFNSALPVLFPSTPTVTATGYEAVGAAASSNPIRVSGRAATSYTAVDPGDTVDFVTTLVGAQIVKSFALPEADWTYAAPSNGVASVNAVTFKAAATTGIRNYLTGLDLAWGSLTNPTEFAIRDGAGGAVLWRTKIPAASAGRVAVTFPTPIKGTAATDMVYIAPAADGTNAIYFNAQGYTAP